MDSVSVSVPGRLAAPVVVLRVAVWEAVAVVWRLSDHAAALGVAAVAWRLLGRTSVASLAFSILLFDLLESTELFLFQ